MSTDSVGSENETSTGPAPDWKQASDSMVSSWMFQGLSDDYREAVTNNRRIQDKANMVLSATTIFAGLVLATASAASWLFTIFVSLGLACLVGEFLLALRLWGTYDSRLMIPHCREWRWEMMCHNSALNVLDEIVKAIEVETIHLPTRTAMFRQLLAMAAATVVLLALAVIGSLVEQLLR